MLLADQLGELPRAPFAGQDQIAHLSDSPHCAVEAARASTPPAPDAAVTVAPFRAWRDSRLIVAEEPTRATIDVAGPGIVRSPPGVVNRENFGGEGGIRTHVGRYAPNRFRVGAVMTASVPLRA